MTSADATAVAVLRLHSPQERCHDGDGPGRSPVRSGRQTTTESPRYSWSAPSAAGSRCTRVVGWAAGMTTWMPSGRALPRDY